jgi:hypothetical protein
MIKLISANRMKTLYLSVLTCVFTQSLQVFGQGELTLLQNLKGTTWLFSIGINEEWISPKFNDNNWETIKVPSAWEDQGFNGYNGYAFYRKKITIPSIYKGRMLYVNLGYVDDVDETYLNGHKIGSTGGFPPDYVTAVYAERKYYCPEEYINFDGSNTIAIKVYDSNGPGGIVSGDVGLYGSKNSINFDVNLQTAWKFRTGDDLRYKDLDYNDSGWEEILVPAYWDDQGYRDYDGYAWYRKSIIYKGSTAKMVIVMGKIDDIDQVYINGTLVGSTGDFPSRPGARASATSEVYAFRGYYIPDGLLKENQKNVIAVRVYDKDGPGGIYEGPVGLLTQTKYIEYWRKIKRAGD